MKSALSDKVANGELTVLDKLDMKEIKTKEIVKVLEALGSVNKTLLVLPEKNEAIYKSARNIPGVKVSLDNTLNVYDMVNCNKMIVLKDAVSKIEEVYA